MTSIARRASSPLACDRARIKMRDVDSERDADEPDASTDAADRASCAARCSTCCARCSPINAERDAVLEIVGKLRREQRGAVAAARAGRSALQERARRSRRAQLVLFLDALGAARASPKRRRRAPTVPTSSTTPTRSSAHASGIDDRRRRRIAKRKHDGRARQPRVADAAPAHLRARRQPVLGARRRSGRVRAAAPSACASGTTSPR